MPTAIRSLLPPTPPLLRPLLCVRFTCVALIAEQPGTIISRTAFERHIGNEFGCPKPVAEPMIRRI